MQCRKCGCEILEDTLRCPMCDAKQRGNNRKRKISPNESNELPMEINEHISNKQYDTTMTNEYPNHSTNNSDRSKSAFIAISMFISLFAVGAFLFFGPLFSSNLDAFELLQRSHDVMSGFDSTIIDFSAEIEIAAAGFSLEMPMTGRIYTEMISETDANIMMEMEISAFGTHTSTTIFYRDGYMYTDLSGERTREAMDLDFALGQIADMTMFDIDITENRIINSSVESRRDGYRLTFELNADAMLDAMGEYAEDLSVADIEGGAFIFTIYLDNNYQQVSSVFDVEVEFMDMGMSADMSISMRTDVVQVGDVTIAFPSWLDSVATIEFIDTADAPFIGYWGNGSGSEWLFVFEEADSVEFLPNGTVIIYEGRMEFIESWSLGSDNILRVAGREFTWEISGEILTIIDSWDDDRTFRREGSTTSSNATQVENSALTGHWNNGSGSIFLFVFRTADEVEFLEDGTVIITEGGSSNTVNWSHTGAGLFTADGHEFTYSINGETLTITDSADDDWTFDRVD